MLSVDEKHIDKITETIYLILKGEVPGPISLPENFPDNELKQLYDYVNTFLVQYQYFSDFMFSIARGDLNYDPPKGRMRVMDSFKSLQANLRHLTWKTQQIAKGDFNQKVDFIGDFSEAFNTMTAQLKEAFLQIKEKNEELYQLNETLKTQSEQLELTNIELQKQKDELQATLKHLKQTQKELIQSEKMASLGLLIAGIAHEINSPLSAIKASVNSIIENGGIGLKQLPQIIKQLPESDFDLFLELIYRSIQNNIIITSKEEREYRKKLTAELESYNIENSDTYADLLVDMGIYNDLEKYIPVLNDRCLNTAFHLTQQLKNSYNIKSAADRVSKIVFALKSFSHTSQNKEPVYANVIDTIETVLTIYSNQLKQGIRIVKEYEPVPAVKCYADELNQVWTNLIHNAIQAMKGRGELKIILKRELPDIDNSDIEYVKISVTDNGCGIPAENYTKIFDAFFTTKSAGEGSGLGLYIVKQIIDKHNGKIWVESEVGKGSVFSVLLPV